MTDTASSGALRDAIDELVDRWLDDADAVESATHGASGRPIAAVRRRIAAESLRGCARSLVETLVRADPPRPDRLRRRCTCTHPSRVHKGTPGAPERCWAQDCGCPSYEREPDSHASRLATAFETALQGAGYGPSRIDEVMERVRPDIERAFASTIPADPAAPSSLPLHFAIAQALSFAGYDPERNWRMADRLGPSAQAAFAPLLEGR